MLQINAIKAITLDLDDTLWPVWPTIDRAEVLLQQWLTQHAPATATLFASAHVRRELRTQAENRLAHLLHDLSALRREMIRLGLEQAGEDTALADPAFDVFFAARNVVSLFDDVLQSLTWLAQRYPLVAVSNGNADVHRVGIGQYFAGSVSARDVGVAKPHARIFEAAAQSLQLAPGDVLHVGDDAHLDVIGALQSGMQAVWVNREDHVWTEDAHPHATVGNLAELCDLLGA